MNFIRDAGWGIWPVLVFGTLSIIVAARYARTPRREDLALVVGFAMATLIVGALGTLIGVQTSASHIGEIAADSRWIFLLGLQESLNNAVAALVIVFFDALLATAGAHRLLRARPDSGEVPVRA